MARFRATHLKPVDEPEEPCGFFLVPRRELPEVESLWFDFNTVIPRPAIYDAITSGSVTDDAVEALTGKPVWEFKPGQRWLQSLRPPPGGARQEKLTPDELAMGAKALEAYEAHGYLDWYDWSIANWGTKWGAYHLWLVTDEPGKLEIKFDTAWSTPVPIFEKLAEMYPTLEFQTFSFDEGWGFACQGHGRDGTYDEDALDANPASYAMVYGEPPPVNDDDEDDNEGDAAHGG